MKWTGTTILAVAGLLAPVPGWAQYPGQVAKNSKESPELRSVAVLEWTGEAGKPKTCRIVPVAVLDEGRLQDGGIYKSRPEPLALAGEVEYELEQDGKPVGLFDIENSGREQGSWVGYGTWKAMPAEKPKPTPAQLAAQMRNDDDAQSDEPVLHRKHHADDPPAAGSASSGTASSAPAADSDPDRPKLHKKDTSSSDTASSQPAAGDDPDRPKLHKKDDSGTPDSGSASSSASADLDRPVLKQSKKKPAEDIGRVDSVATQTDPDRPLLKRGKANGNNLGVVPSLMGLPPDMQQAVAVSDAKSHPAHPWDFSWANPEDEAKMRSSLEDMARDALGLKAPPPPPAPAPKPGARRKVKPAPEPPPPAPLLDEQFRVFELAYGSGATMVLTAHTEGSGAQQKFVTLVAQPDLYGNVQVLLKNVTDAAHLDEAPRMRLVDAVDAMADNRGELLFELRGETQRQFALYRVLRGRAEQLFVSGGGEFGVASTN
jgi:hypothetical protein